MGNAAVAPSISLWLGLEHDPANLARPDQERTPNWPWRTGDQGRRIGRANKVSISSARYCLKGESQCSRVVVRCIAGWGRNEKRATPMHNETPAASRRRDCLGTGAPSSCKWAEAGWLPVCLLEGGSLVVQVVQEVPLEEVPVA